MYIYGRYKKEVFMSIFVGTTIFYFRTNIAVLSTVDAIHRHFQWTTYLCFAWILRRNFVCISFFPSFSIWPLQPNFKCIATLDHFQWHARARAHTHTQTHTHIIINRTPLDEWSACCRDLYLTTHNIHKEHTSTSPAEVETAVPASEGCRLTP
jgi:hypothetical protein